VEKGVNSINKKTTCQTFIRLLRLCVANWREIQRLWLQGSYQQRGRNHYKCWI